MSHSLCIQISLVKNWLCFLSSFFLLTRFLIPICHTNFFFSAHLPTIYVFFFLLSYLLCFLSSLVLLTMFSVLSEPTCFLSSLVLLTMFSVLSCPTYYVFCPVLSYLLCFLSSIVLLTISSVLISPSIYIISSNIFTVYASILTSRQCLQALYVFSPHVYIYICFQSSCFPIYMLSVLI